MALISFNDLPDTARLFSFNSDRTIPGDEVDRFRGDIEAFLADWTAHNRELRVGYDVRYGHFLLIGVDESLRSPSGCSVDALVGALKHIGGRFGIDLVDSPDVTYLSDDGVRAVTRDEFARLADAGIVNDSTIVFDRTVPSVGDVRNGLWERPARQSWHARAFALKERSGS